MPGVSKGEGTLPSTAESADRTVSDHQQRAHWTWRAFQGLPLLGAAFYCASNNSSNLVPTGDTSTQTYRLQMLAMIANLLPLQTIWTVESVRRGNASSPLSLVSPAIWGVLSQVRGIGSIGPIYYFLHYVLTPPERYRAQEDTMVDLQEAKALIPAVVVGYGIPILAGVFLPSSVLESRPWVIRALGEALPVLTTMLQRTCRVIFETGTSTETEKEGEEDSLEVKKKDKMRQDLRFLRFAYIFSGTTSTVLSLYLRYVTGSSWLPAEFTSSNGWDWGRCASSLALAAGLFWEVLHWIELKDLGKTKANWFHLGTAIAGTAVVAGPHTAAMVGWTCRDQVLGRRVQR